MAESAAMLGGSTTATVRMSFTRDVFTSEDRGSLPMAFSAVWS